MNYNIELSGAEHEILLEMISEELEETRELFRRSGSMEERQRLKDREEILKEMMTKLGPDY